MGIPIWLVGVTTAATFCNVAFGFDIGVVSGSLADLASSLNLTTIEQEAAYVCRDDYVASPSLPSNSTYHLADVRRLPLSLGWRTFVFKDVWAQLHVWSWSDCCKRYFVRYTWPKKDAANSCRAAILGLNHGRIGLLVCTAACWQGIARVGERLFSCCMLVSTTALAQVLIPGPPYH